MTAPVAYQGGKSRLADAILSHIGPIDNNLYDLCCGSGSVGIAAVRRGLSPGRLHMWDQGPWGLVWQSIGSGNFSMERFKLHVAAIPNNAKHVQAFMKDLSNTPATEDVEYIYPILQAASFGGKSIWVKDGKWCNCSFRNYWEPTPTSSRRSHVNPMMPMPKTLLLRFDSVCDLMFGVNGRCEDVTSVQVEPGDKVYIDPPYSGTTSYGYVCDVVSLAGRLSNVVDVYVSEGKPLSPSAYELSSGRTKGGVSGNRKKKPNQEWLSVFAHEQPTIGLTEVAA